MNKRLKQLRELDQSVWLDAISRDDIETGDLQLFIRDGLYGVTSNPTMFQKVITASSYYNSQIVDLLDTTHDPREIFRHLATTDVRRVCDLLMPIFERTERRDDGCVSLEVAPDLAHDTQETVERAKLLWEMVDRPNLLVMIPATAEGLAAIEECVAQGISISPTLVFSPERYRDVAQAYIRGLQQLVESGGDPSKVTGLANFLVSRLDTEVDDRLVDVDREDLRGKLAVANAKLAYQEFKQIYSTDEWSELEAQGANKQRLLWSSTSTKNAEYSPVKYVENLIGPDTATTLPKGTLVLTMDRVDPRPTVEEGVDDARRHLEQLEEAGVDYDDVISTLEEEGIKNYLHSHNELLEEVRQRSELLSHRR